MWARVCCLLLVPTVLGAQETPTYDLDGESILSLAVDPAEHRGEDYVVLFEDGYVRIEADGSTSSTFRQVVQILTNEGASHYGEWSIPYDSGTQEAEIDWVRVLQDGQVVTDAPSLVRESSPSVDQSAPIYDEVRMIQATIPGVRRGTIVDIQSSVDTNRPRVVGDFLYARNLNGLDRVVRGRLRVDRPESLEIRIEESGAGMSSIEEVRDGRRITTWTTRDLEPIEIEPYAGFPNDVLMQVRISGGMTWEELAERYAELFLDGDRELASDLLAAHAAELEGAKSLRDSLARTYRWVAQDFRYVSLALGDGGYRPRPPAEVYVSGFGDCKDKTTLFVTLARHMGAEAYPVLVAIDGGVNAAHPALGQFDHMIAALELDGETLYLDLTASIIPFGELPPLLDDERGLAVRADGSGELVELPTSDPDENYLSVVVEGELSLAVGFIGSITVEGRGTEQFSLRDNFYGAEDLDQRELDTMLGDIAKSVFETAVVDSSSYFDGRDLGAPARVTVWFTAPAILGTVGEQYLLYLPVTRFSNPSVLAEVQADDERLFPIDVAQVNSPAIYRGSFHVELPNGWTVDPPDDVVVKGDLGYYAARFAQEGNRFEAWREMGGGRGLLPPDRAPSLIEFLEGVAEDETEYVLIDPNGPSTLVASSEGLAAVLPTADDFDAGASVASDGTSNTFESFDVLHSEPRAAHARDFEAAQMVFRLGGSQLANATFYAAEFNTAEEARKNASFLELLDLGELMAVAMEQEMGQDMSVADVREIELPSLGDAFRGWIIPLQTPLGAFDMVVGALTRGRVSVSTFTFGVAGVQAQDFDALFTAVDARIRERPEFLSDIEPVADVDTTADEPDASDDADGYRLQDIPPRAADIPGTVTVSEDFRLEDGVPLYERHLEGRGFTFVKSGVEVIWLETDVELLPTAGWAAKEVGIAQRSQPWGFLDMDIFGDGDAREAVFGDASIEEMDLPDAGPIVHTGAGHLEGMIDVDLAFAVFAQGRFKVTLQLVTPPGAFEERVMVDLVSEIRDRIEQMESDLPSASEAAALMTEIDRLMDLEEDVSALLADDEYEDLFDLVEEHYPVGDEVTFQPTLWNNICWFGALEGHAERALPACELAVTPNPEHLGRRDSRALARALTGDVDGAIEDFEYIVDRSADGDFKTLRAGWLRALRAGDDPFTEEVLGNLR